MNRLRIIAGSLVALVLLVFMGCAPKTAPATERIIATPIAESPAKSIKDIKWDKTLEVARKEGSVVIMGGSGAAALKDAVGMIKDKFGFALAVTSARGEQIFAKLSMERGAGIYGADLILTGHNSMFTMKAKGMYDPLEPLLMLPEVLEPEVWLWGKLPWADEQRYMFNLSYFPEEAAAINTGIIKPGEINSYYDILSPKWKDKIITADPTTTGSGGPMVWSLVHNKVLNLDYFRQLVLQKPIISRDDDLILRWLATGKYPIALFPSSGVVARYKAVGAPIERQEMKEAQVLSAGGMALALMNKAPHPNAAAIFVNWLLSREGSTFIQNVQQKQSARIDVSIEGLDAVNRRTPGVEYIRKVNEVEELILAKEDEKFFEAMREIFAPALR